MPVAMDGQIASTGKRPVLMMAQLAETRNGDKNMRDDDYAKARGKKHGFTLETLAELHNWACRMPLFVYDEADDVILHEGETLNYDDMCKNLHIDWWITHRFRETQNIFCTMQEHMVDDLDYVDFAFMFFSRMWNEAICINGSSIS